MKLFLPPVNRALLLLLTFALFGAAGAPRLAIGPQADHPVRLAFTFDGKFWDGARVQHASIATLSLVAPARIRVDSIIDGKPAPPREMQVARDGTLLPGDSWNAAYNTVAAIAAAAPRSVEAGTTWKAIVQVDLTDTTVDVPLDVRVASVESGRTVIQATGVRETSVTTHNYTNPIRLTVKLAVAFTNDGFQRADCAILDAVSAGPMSQTMAWGWTLSNAPAE